jgi:hypothetical protein
MYHDPRLCYVSRQWRAVEHLRSPNTATTRTCEVQTTAVCGLCNDVVGISYHVLVKDCMVQGCAAKRTLHIWGTVPGFGPSLWPRGLRHELSLPVQTVRSWVRIPLEGWMNVCVCSVSVLFCVQVATLRWADLPFKESYRLYTWSRNWKGGQGPTKGCRAIDRYHHLTRELRKTTETSVRIAETLAVQLPNTNQRYCLSQPRAMRILVLRDVIV